MEVECIEIGNFFLNETETTEIYTYLHTLSLHDALPISRRENERQQTYSFPKVNGKGAERARPSGNAVSSRTAYCNTPPPSARTALQGDRKSTRLNSSH